MIRFLLLIFFLCVMIKEIENPRVCIENVHLYRSTITSEVKDYLKITLGNDQGIIERIFEKLWTWKSFDQQERQILNKISEQALPDHIVTLLRTRRILKGNPYIQEKNGKYYIHAYAIFDKQGEWHEESTLRKKLLNTLLQKCIGREFQGSFPSSFSQSLCEELASRNIFTLRDLVSKMVRDILSMEGMGKRKLAYIEWLVQSFWLELGMDVDHYIQTGEVKMQTQE